MKHKVSIITPTYNSERFISETIEAIQTQTYKNWELLITDDCSTDDTVEIVKKYQKKDDRVKLYVLEKNGGAGVARNNSIGKATGRFIAFCDSDDVWKKNKLRKQVAFMLKTQCNLSFSSYDIVDESGNPKGRVKALGKVTYKIMLRNNYIGCLTAVYDTQKIGKVYMPTIRKRQDWALWLKVLRKGKVAYGLEESLAVYRDRSNSISTNKLEMLKYNWSIYKDVEKFSFIHSVWLMVQFLVYYLLKKSKI